MTKLLKHFIVIFALFFSGISVADSFSSIWSAKTSREYYYIAGDRISLGVIQIKADDWRDTNYINRQVANAPKMNYLWDDRWYYATLPDSSSDVLVLFWKNHDTNKQGWVLIKNTPDVWYYMINSGNAQTLKGEGDPKGKVNLFWNEFGTVNNGQGSLSIDIMNPKNEGDMTANDILVGFGK
jgi:hypothetical protein